MMDLRTAARLLGGKVNGRGINCPGRGHSAQDESISVTFSSSAPDGLLVFDHAGGDHLRAKDYVRELLGFIGAEKNRVAAYGSELRGTPKFVLVPRHSEGGGETPPPSSSDRTALALRIWKEARQPAESPVARHLARRGLELIPDVHDVLRFHPSVHFAGNRTRAMVALVRNIVTNEPQAIHRTALSLDGQKIEVNGKDRLALGSIRGGAVKLTADEEVTTCLGIGEGIETTLSLQCLPEFGASPVWSVLNAGGIASFPALPGIECLWIAVDDDPAGHASSELCADRWRRAGREVFLVRPTIAGADLNDIAREARHG